MGWQSMSTVGHFITMIGVFAFYAMIFDAHYERKTAAYLHTLMPRFNKRVTYYLYKTMHLQLIIKQSAILPNKRAMQVLQTVV